MAITFPEVPAHRRDGTIDRLEDAHAALVRFLDAHPRLVVLTGAGCSTSSGIPAYRDEDGTWKQRRPVQFQEFVNDERWRRRYWARSMRGFPVMARAMPNATHRWLASLTERGRVELLVTQNVDGLHQRAGCEDVVDLHGNIHSVRCLDCGAGTARTAMQRRLEALNPDHEGVSSEIRPDGDADVEQALVEDFRVPDCADCGGTLKPDVVFFGESVPRDRVERVREALERADALLVLGSSLMVFSGYRFAREMARLGKPMASVTQGRTRADDLLDLRLRVDCAALCARLLDSG